MLKLCFVVFLGRLVDMAIGTIRTIYTVKGKLKLSFLFGFIEALLYFIVVKSAIVSDINTIYITLAYATGYATGSLLGTYISSNFINNFLSVRVITIKDNKKLINATRENGYGVSVITLNNNYDEVEKDMLIFELHKKSLKRLINIIQEYDSSAFIVINENRVIQNGFIK